MELLLSVSFLTSTLFSGLHLFLRWANSFNLQLNDIVLKIKLIRESSYAKGDTPKNEIQIHTWLVLVSYV